MNVIMVHSILTAILLVVFIAIVLWAWSGKRTRRFEEAARMPLEDDEQPPGKAARAGEVNSGERGDG